MGKEAAKETLVLDGREVQITHPDKLYFSAQARVTKLDLVRYYLSVAPGALHGIKDRPVVLKRFGLSRYHFLPGELPKRWSSTRLRV